jgi:heme/copper-type cytochrome/quinol oxidase subunit 1
VHLDVERECTVVGVPELLRRAVENVVRNAIKHAPPGTVVDVSLDVSGSNVTVPAHYHGSIVAVTLAFMGLTYHLLPRLGFREPVGRMVRLQPVIYGLGQLFHVLGLAWSGGYGVQRKTAGAAQGLESIEKIAGMGLMGLGGLIAIIGGVLFLVVVFRSMWPERRD